MQSQYFVSEPSKEQDSDIYHSYYFLHLQNHHHDQKGNLSLYYADYKCMYYFSFVAYIPN